MAMQQLMLGYGAKQKTYVDDVFSTYVYIGNDTSGRAINNGIDLSGKGGLVWVKARNDTTDYQLIDTVRGANKFIKSNADDAEGTIGNRVTGFNSNGFTLGASALVNGSSAYNYASWTLRKAEGFFDIVTWTGNGTNGRQISHSLSSIPGCIMVKCTSETQSWSVYHRGLNSGITPEQYHLVLNNNLDEDTTSDWNDTAATSTHFTVGDGNRINANNKTYVAYLFAGGESDAATARSVDLDGSGDYLDVVNSSDFSFGSGDFTVEGWFKVNSNSAAQTIIGVWDNTNNQRSWLIEANNSGGLGFSVSNNGSSSVDVVGTNCVYAGQWTHFAAVRDGDTLKLFVNGTQVATSSYSMTLYNNTNDKCFIGLLNGASNILTGKLSNIRVVKGTAVYTSSFRPPTEPLTNITNTKLLCCNNASVTGSTVTPGTIDATGNPTASTDSPFDDPAGFAFAKNEDQNLVKCGSYVGNSTANHEVYIGWEPQWWLVKNVSDNQNWQLLDSTRGWVSEGNDQYLVPNSNVGGSPFNFGNPTPTGFNLSNASSNWQNESGKSYVYIAIRRPDGYVGKPADAGTDVFAMDTGNSSSTIPAFTSGFPVDFGLERKPATAQSWMVGARLTGDKYYYTDNTTAQNTWANALVWDSNEGWIKYSSYNTNDMSWMWKRHAGCDVVTWIGDGANRTIPHSCGKSPEMIWIKNRSTTNHWIIGHKGLNGGTNPWEKYLRFTNESEFDFDMFQDNAPTSTHFDVKANDHVNEVNCQIIAMLFASVDGISKVGYYTGTGGTRTITTGFQPRFLIYKKTSSTQDWFVLDTTRGWGSGDDKYLELNNNNDQDDFQFGAPTSTGFTVEDYNNTSGANFIYYCHA